MAKLRRSPWWPPSSGQLLIGDTGNFRGKECRDDRRSGSYVVAVPEDARFAEIVSAALGRRVMLAPAGAPHTVVDPDA